MPDQIDPIQFEVIRNALLEATEEMAIALRRSAYSTNIKTRADFSCAFFDRQLRPVAQAFTQPVHLGSLTILTPRAVAEYGPENLQAGDAILVNDPYRGGVHLNDITLISPVYCGDELFGYVANLAHHVDVGGGAPASIGAFQQVYQEGIIIPPVKLVRGGGTSHRPDPLQARDARRLSRPSGGQSLGGSPAQRARRTGRVGASVFLHGSAHRLHQRADASRVGQVAQGGVHGHRRRR
ncbi:MAG: hydantoinase B/oxoprolinase family protein [Candidatus Latescibacteria bacterium]|nr:hydantoinase B/oxoprolinase family protein [Candidatus Latescibacterota bacterium]